MNADEPSRESGVKYARTDTRDTQPPGEELAVDLERMGPTFIKFGQLLANRGEFLPPGYVEALGFKVDTGIKPAELMVGLQKVANRITVGLVIAAMIVSAAMMMRIPGENTILGYPWLAMIFFVMAAGSAAILLFNTFIKDSPFSRRSKREITREE